MKIPLWRLTTARRKLLESVGIRRLSSPAYGNLEKFLAKHLPTKGFFVEAGAVDGFFESNTYHLERFANWRGILIEPVPEMCARIKTNRKKSTAVNAALVSNEYEANKIQISPNHATTSVSSEDTTATIAVPARTLTSVLDALQSPSIDFMSLDVEGFEAEALRGLDLRKHKPKFLLVECLNQANRDEILPLLSAHYELIECPTHRDLFFRAFN